MAAISYIGAGTAANTTAYASSVTPGLPTYQSGDLLIVVAHHYGTSSAVVQTPSGYTSIGTPSASTTYGSLGVFWKIAGSSETAPTITTSPSISDKFTARIFSFRGVDQTTPIDVAGSIVDQAAATTWTGATVNIATAQSMVCFAGGSRDDNTWNTWGGGIDTGVYTANSASTNDNSVFLGYKANPLTQPTGVCTAPSAVQATLGADAGRRITFALRPAAQTNYGGTAPLAAVTRASSVGGVTATGGSRLVRGTVVSAIAANTNTAASVTVASVAAGDLLVALVTANSTTRPPTYAVTSANLAWTMRQSSESGSNGTAQVWTAVAAGALTNEVVSVSVDNSFARPAICVVPYSGANVAQLTLGAVGYNGGATAISLSVSSTEQGAEVLACFQGFTNNSSATPTAGTTELADLGDSIANNSNWFARSTNRSAGGTVTIDGTWASSQEWHGAAIEVRVDTGNATAPLVPVSGTASTGGVHAVGLTGGLAPLAAVTAVASTPGLAVQGTIPDLHIITGLGNFGYVDGGAPCGVFDVAPGGHEDHFIFIQGLEGSNNLQIIHGPIGRTPSVVNVPTDGEVWYTCTSWDTTNWKLHCTSLSLASELSIYYTRLAPTRDGSGRITGFTKEAHFVLNTGSGATYANANKVIVDGNGNERILLFFGVDDWASATTSRSCCLVTDNVTPSAASSFKGFDGSANRTELFTWTNGGQGSLNGTYGTGNAIGQHINSKTLRLVSSQGLHGADGWKKRCSVTISGSTLTAGSVTTFATTGTGGVAMVSAASDDSIIYAWENGDTSNNPISKIFADGTVNDSPFPPVGWVTEYPGHCHISEQAGRLAVLWHSSESYYPQLIRARFYNGSSWGTWREVDHPGNTLIIWTGFGNIGRTADGRYWTGAAGVYNDYSTPPILAFTSLLPVVISVLPPVTATASVGGVTARVSARANLGAVTGTSSVAQVSARIGVHASLTAASRASSTGGVTAKGAAKALLAGVQAASSAASLAVRGAARATLTAVSRASTAAALSVRAAARSILAPAVATAAAAVISASGFLNLPGTAQLNGVSRPSSVGVITARGAARASLAGISRSSSVGVVAATGKATRGLTAASVVGSAASVAAFGGVAHVNGSAGLAPCVAMSVAGAAQARGKARCSMSAVAVVGSVERVLAHTYLLTARKLPTVYIAVSRTPCKVVASQPVVGVQTLINAVNLKG